MLREVEDCPQAPDRREGRAGVPVGPQCQDQALPVPSFTPIFFVAGSLGGFALLVAQRV